MPASHRGPFLEFFWDAVGRQQQRRGCFVAPMARW